MEERPVHFSDNFTIRPATAEDVPAILSLVRGLAAYEKMESACVATEAGLKEWIFDKGKAEAVIGEAAGRVVGFALFSGSFSTFLAKPGIYLENLFVIPEMRGRGYGKRLLQYLAKLVVSRGYGRLEWVCLDWNKPSIDFYLSLDAVRQNEWTTYRLAGDALDALAEANLDRT